MRIFTVTRDGRAAAVVRATNGPEAIALARALSGQDESAGAVEARRWAVREPDDAEMVSWLERRADHLVAAPEPEPAAALS